MKKIDKTLASTVGLIFAMLFFSQWYLQFKENKEPDETTKKLLSYIYGIKNLTLEEKMTLIEESPYFPREWKKKLDEEMAHEIFPDKDTLYSIDTPFIIAFHKENGNPKISFGRFWNDCDHNRYILSSHTIVLTTFACKNGRPTSFSQTGYFDELAHARQWSSAPIKYTLRYWNEQMENWIGKAGEKIFPFLSFREPGLPEGYESEIEYEAHEIIGPALKRAYLAYRRVYFREKIYQEKDGDYIFFAHTPNLVPIRKLQRKIKQEFLNPNK